MEEIHQIKLKRGLKFKFILLISALFIVMGAILGAILMTSLKRPFEDQLKKRGLAVATNIASVSVFSVSTEDNSMLVPMIRRVARESDIAYVIVLNNEGKVIVHTDEKEIGKTLTDPLTEQALRVNKPTMFPYVRNSENFYDVVAPSTLKLSQNLSLGEEEEASEKGSKVGVVRLGLSLKNIEKEIRRFLLITFSVLVVLIGLAIFTSLFFVRIIATPLERMTHVAVQIAGGDLSQTIQASSQDEVGILANAFSQMTAGLKGVIRKIQEASYEIISGSEQMLTNTKKVSDGAIHQARAAEKTSSSIEEMNASIKDISENVDGLSGLAETSSSSLIEMSASINEVANSAMILSSSVEDTSSALLQMSSSITQVTQNIDTLSGNAEETTVSISEINASIKEVEKNAKESALLSEKVSQDAKELGIGAIEKTIEGMEKIRKTVEKSSTVISKLGERTEHVGKILTVIDEVTRQTNLLALNAAILAAQAGEQGKGFTVVADEIKSLADRTATSTKEIAQLIRDVQSEAKDAVVSIKEGAKSVEEGVQLSVNARESLSHILDSSKRSSEMSRQIEKATLEQVLAINRVTGAMEKMNSMVQQINAAMQEQGKGTGHITNAAEKMRMITRQVKASTEEQAKGSKQISDAVENVTTRIQQIARAMNEQKKGSEIIMKSIVEIREITQLSVQMVQQMNQGVEGLINQANTLKGAVNSFKI